MIPLFKPFMSDTAKDMVVKTLYSGYLAQGPRVEEFEGKLKKFLQVRNILTVNAGTNALQLAVHLAGIKPGIGGKIISTPMTCSATNTAIAAMGGEIVWADVDPLTGNINPNSVEDRLKEHPDTKAVMVVHWGGRPCNLDKLDYLGQKYNVKIIEDAAHAFGAMYKDEFIGNHSDFVCYSFQAIKHLTTGDGGAIVCRNPEDHNRGKLLRWFGIDRDQPRGDFRCEEDIAEAGYKYHMNDINATIGLANFDEAIDTVLITHIENAEYYNNELAESDNVVIPPVNRLDLPSYWIYTIHVPNRHEFMKHMAEKGIVTSQVHARNDLHSMFAQYKRELPGVDLFTKTQVNIPVGWWVTKENREYIVNTIKEFYNE